MTTAILEAGRMSLDAKGGAISIKYAMTQAEAAGAASPHDACTPTAVEPEA
jgi:hypothetical protein